MGDEVDDVTSSCEHLAQTCGQIATSTHCGIKIDSNPQLEHLFSNKADHAFKANGLDMNSLPNLD